MPTECMMTGFAFGCRPALADGGRIDHCRAPKKNGRDIPAVFQFGCFLCAAPAAQEAVSLGGHRLLQA